MAQLLQCTAIRPKCGHDKTMGAQMRDAAFRVEVAGARCGVTVEPMTGTFWMLMASAALAARHHGRRG